MWDEESTRSKNIAEFSKTINVKDAILLSAKCWEEVEPITVTRNWSKLLQVYDSS